uniref:Putative ovule protein n=1 Tax=Solanum chacoense TaxID=4108 RepID=A0A0V0HF46_SOLCH
MFNQRGVMKIYHYSYIAIVPFCYLFLIYTSQSTLNSYQEKGKLLTLSFINMSDFPNIQGL